MARSKGFYPQTLDVPGKRIAGKNPIGTVELGSSPPPTAPTREGFSHGFGPHPHAFGHPTPKGAHGWGHPPRHRFGHLRTSGVTGAHRIGAPSKLK